MPFLPLTIEEMKQYGWEQPDFIYVTGDAYIDHPSFGPAIITRILENFGYKCCIISQPDINDDNAFKTFGLPRLAFLVSSGNIDSMVNHYTVAKKRRTKDYYTPNGEMGKRPDRALIRYCEKIRQIYPDTNIIIGGIEASLRRLSHYDYWSDTVKKSILLDSKADLLLYGMGEKTIVEVADALNSGLDIKDLIYIRNTVWKTKDVNILPYEHDKLPSYREVVNDKMKYLESFKMQYKGTNPYLSNPLVEKYGDTYIVQNLPEFPLTREEMDMVYELPYMRCCHPLLESIGHVPAIDEVKFSIVSNRGCFGGCNFCALTFHQGRIIQSRSKESIVNEAKLLTQDKDFKGYIHDVGGPTANFYNPSCDRQKEHGVCTSNTCLGFKPCRNLKVDHSEYLDILRAVRKLDKVKKVFIRSGIRYDYLMYDKNDEFENKYKKLNQQFNKNQFLVPYLMSSHPGSTLKEAINLAVYLKQKKLKVEQVQDFYPTPGTASTCMYYTGIDPFTMEKVYVPKSAHEKAMQRALMQYYIPKNYDLIKEALIKANRTDLIGDGPNCLIKFKKQENHYNNSKYQNKPIKNKKKNK